MAIKSFDALTGREVYEMIRLREQIFVVEQACAYLDADGYDPDCHILLAWDGECLLGTLRVMPAGVKYEDISIGRVVVNEASRGKGVAYQMMIEAMAFIKEYYGPSLVMLSAQLVIKSLYEKCGFKVVSGVYLEDGIEHVKMVFDGRE